MNGTADPVQAAVLATESLTFFDQKGMVFTNYVPKGKTVNANSFIKALYMFMKVVKEKRPEMCTGEVLIYWDSAHSD
jgi:hypothetical protein